MHIRRATLLVVALVTACASTGSSAYHLHQVDVAPELRGCSGYPEEGLTRGYNVLVQFVVDASGQVMPQTVKTLPRRSLVGR
jgi:outer membrane biosynthesis protein TonB